VAYGLYALSQISIGAVPDITNNQVQVIATSRNLATEDVEKYLTYPVELEMANLPGVKEIRSVSKFGLSVVTIVFEDDLGTYLPRQLISEKLASVTNEIQAEFGQPFMGPITTGLGEIYQYTLELEPGYEDQYDVMSLRSIQDWVVQRQLSGIPGVVEVNTWGGELKQYQLALDPERMRNLNISLDRVFKAIENNNSLAGGAYIERNDQSYFIRSEGLVQTIEDIESIVVDGGKGKPILVRDIAAVQIGSAPRFGAITANGEGEKVMGQIMMLKDANSQAVIKAVKERVAKIEKSLPPGIRINPFLERSELIGKTTFTITENLVFGFLIVMFVVIILLGNFRSGLVVASMIPITLLFAIGLMYLFGIDANLMSLGAIDFGIIIDGAVIIVEYIAYRISQSFKDLSVDGLKRQERLDKITEEAAGKMMHSALFGQIIIIIVFIPILSLAGVEGKMFKPMALVFSFALIGAMILCFTYVPVMASLILRPAKTDKVRLADRIMIRLQNLYHPTINWSLRNMRAIFALALLLMLGAGVLFNRIGGEFVPTLDEGDFVIQPVLKTGTSLGRTIDLTTQMESILLEFPEVDQVVSRIGAAEIPTDPMSMEEADVIIKLKPRKEWPERQSKDELADRFKTALMVIPGLDYEFTQPIEMRFNELITGVRADVAIKVFGEDLDRLSTIANQIKQAIEEVPGAADISVEKVVGLPQFKVEFDRGRMARYGLQVEDVNKLIETGFAGSTAGHIYEGEKKFDISLRFENGFRNEASDLERIRIQTAEGSQIPLSEVARITETKGPAKISRDDTKRRIVVGVNVRNRDLESVVEEVQEVIADNVELPSGYLIEYGGQFQNLRTARKRLAIALPIALILIFILLYFAFRSLADAFMIFSAIPLSAIGGVVFLYLRDMPFSISAGVGFIALFGIAVLNGIVLIEEFNSMLKSGKEDLKEVIRKAASNRLRPVLLTASAAALGFLPMAISTSAGAEVQRPLATVVIGGLLSSTALTLVILPVLYYWRHSASKPKLNLGLLIPLLLLSPLASEAQVQVRDLQHLEEIALQHNQGIKAMALATDIEKEKKGASLDIPKTGFYYSFDENNIAENNAPIEVWGIEQSLAFPLKYIRQNQAQEERLQLAYLEEQKRLMRFKKALGDAYYEAIYQHKLYEEYRKLNALFENIGEQVQQELDLGGINKLQYLSIRSKAESIRIKSQQFELNAQAARGKLLALVQCPDSLIFNFKDFPTSTKDIPDSINDLATQYQFQELNLLEAERKMYAAAWWPDLSLGYFQGTNDLPNARLYQGWQFGISLPLWFTPQKSASKAAKLNVAKKKAELNDFQSLLYQEHLRLKLELRELEKQLNYFTGEQMPLIKELRFQAQKSFQSGEISYLEYLEFQEQALDLELEFFRLQRDYHFKLGALKYLVL